MNGCNSGPPSNHSQRQPTPQPMIQQQQQQQLGSMLSSSNLQMPPQTPPNSHMTPPPYGPNSFSLNNQQGSPLSLEKHKTELNKNS
jgi:hypothetical protein